MTTRHRMKTEYWCWKCIGRWVNGQCDRWMQPCDHCGRVMPLWKHEVPVHTRHRKPAAPKEQA